MRIYNEKKYIVFKPGETEGTNAYIVTGSELREWLKAGSLDDGDQIYRADLVATAVEKREIVLEEAVIEQSE